MFYPIGYGIIVKSNLGAKSMENCINEKEMLTAALESIEGFCKLYASKEMDQNAFCKALADIPEILWKEKDSSLAMITALAENDDLYEFFQEGCESTPSVIGAMIPRTFWNNKENVLGAIELLIEILFRDFEYANCYEIDTVIPVQHHINIMLHRNPDYYGKIKVIVLKDEERMCNQMVFVEGFNGKTNENGELLMDIPLSSQRDCYSIKFGEYSGVIPMPTIETQCVVLNK
jgi:hypothetical protein